MHYAHLLLLTMGLWTLVKGHAPPSSGSQSLDLSEGFHLEWEVDSSHERVTFLVVGETLGYVGFGISPNGGMDGADMVIGGVLPNGFAYISVIFLAHACKTV